MLEVLLEVLPVKVWGVARGVVWAGVAVWGVLEGKGKMVRMGAAGMGLLRALEGAFTEFAKCAEFVEFVELVALEGAFWGVVECVEFAEFAEFGALEAVLDVDVLAGFKMKNPPASAVKPSTPPKTGIQTLFVPFPRAGGLGFCLELGTCTVGVLLLVLGVFGVLGILTVRVCPFCPFCPVGWPAG
jgi:hypothetical protein